MTPETILRWHRRLIARKWDFSAKRKSPGRPPIERTIADITIKIARDNPTWGYDRIDRSIARFITNRVKSKSGICQWAVPEQRTKSGKGTPNLESISIMSGNHDAESSELELSKSRMDRQNGKIERASRHASALAVCPVPKVGTLASSATSAATSRPAPGKLRVERHVGPHE